MAPLEAELRYGFYVPPTGDSATRKEEFKSSRASSCHFPHRAPGSQRLVGHGHLLEVASAAASGALLFPFSPGESPGVVHVRKAPLVSELGLIILVEKKNGGRFQKAEAFI